MANVAIAEGATTRPNYGSMSKDRRWALRWSYFFLVLFAIFFLMPPIYMLITSLKTSAEISAATNPWWVFNPTLGFQYQATPNIFPGVEAWMRAEIEPGAEEEEADFDAGPHVYVGPTLMVNLGTFFVTTGYYLRTTQFGRPLALGDAMGASWYRLIVGFNM